MTEYKDNIEHSNCTEESEIDLMEIVAKLWKGRKFILKCCEVEIGRASCRERVCLYV